jgi:glycosyltransferase involved in cell wall biosynthesis
MADIAPPQVLIVAPNASARFGGEAFLPLKYFQILCGRGHPVRMIAHARNRDELADTLGSWIDRVDFVEDTAWHRAIWQVGRHFPARIRDSLFGVALNIVNDACQARIIRRRVAAGEVDLIHQPIPVSPRAPSGIHGFGVPVVIGPMNGGMAYPPGYEGMEGRTTRALVGLGRAFSVMANRLSPGKRRAALLLVANARTQAALPVPQGNRVVTLVENGVDFSTWAAPVTVVPRPATGFRLAFMGRLVDWKAVDLTLEALRLARAQGADVTLDILGDGPERATLASLATPLGNAVRFHGFLPQSACVPILAGADALILNSVWECGGAVVLEAMALGLPVIASDWGGPADYLDPTCGILVHPSPRESFAARLATAIGQLAADPDQARRMGAAGKAKVRRDYNWNTKVDQMVALYDLALGR